MSIYGNSKRSYFARVFLYLYLVKFPKIVHNTVRIRVRVIDQSKSET